MNILIVRNNSNPAAVDAAALLQAWAAGADIDIDTLDSDSLDTAPRGDWELAVVLGGDGTILRTAGFIGRTGVPILGINFGRLGFLANGVGDGVVAAVSAALAGDAVREERTNLDIRVLCEGDDEDAFDHTLAGDPADAERAYFSLNEVALTRGAGGRIIDFSVDIAGQRVAQLRGDGVVVATATGSTAYALSAGGPLVSPGFGGLVVVPLAPHTVKSRALVTGTVDVVDIGLDAESVSSREATLFVDGNLISLPAPIKRVVVRAGSTPTTLLRYKGQGFYAHAADVFFA